MRLRRAVPVLLVVTAVAGCAGDGRPVSELGPGQVTFDVRFDPMAFAGHQADHAQRCLRRDYVESGLTRQSRPPLLSATTAATTTAEQNRELHRCLLVISSASVGAVPGSRGHEAYESDLVIEYDD